MQVKKNIDDFVEKFNHDDTTTWAASLAFYAALSLAPLLILFVTISSQFSEPLQQSLVTGARQLIGDDGANLIATVVRSANARSDFTSFTGVISILTLLVSASLIFGQLRATLNRIFDVQLRKRSGDSFLRITGRYLEERVFQLGLALIFILALIISLMLSPLLANFFGDLSQPVSSVLKVVIGLMFYIGLFTILFRYLPDQNQEWRRAVPAGVVTSVLFMLGKSLIGVYLHQSAIGSSYGAASSIIVLLVWVYYSSLITFVGAQVSWIFYHEPSR